MVSCTVLPVVSRVQKNACNPLASGVHEQSHLESFQAWQIQPGILYLTSAFRKWAGKRGAGFTTLHFFHMFEFWVWDLGCFVLTLLLYEWVSDSERGLEPTVLLVVVHRTLIIPCRILYFEYSVLQRLVWWTGVPGKSISSVLSEV